MEFEVSGVCKLDSDNKNNEFVYENILFQHLKNT